MVEKTGLVSILEAQITQWDCWVSARAREHFESILELADRTNELRYMGSMFRLPCHDLASMALESLVKYSGFSEDYFETSSDCLHMKSPQSGFHHPQYAEALLDVRLSCLFVLDHLEDAEHLAAKDIWSLVIAEVRELIAALSALENVIESRHFADQDLTLKVQEIKSENALRMKKARENRQATHDWTEVEKLERILLDSGKNERELAGIIKARLRVPTPTYRAWRKKRSLND